MNNIKEQWKPIKGYEGLYEISNKGRIKSLPKKVKRGNGYMTTTTQIRTTHLDKNGYERITLSNKFGNKRNELVHRLVAIVFIPNPNNLSDVNHINEVKHHNFVENLEWCTHKHNCNHGTSSNRIGKKLSKSVYQYDINGNFIKQWNSVSEVSRVTGFSKGNISLNCRGGSITCNGFKWSYTPLH